MDTPHIDTRDDETGPIEVRVNGEDRTVPPDCTVAALIQSLGLGDRRLAVAVNRAVVPRSGYDAHTLAPGDRIEILEAVGGG